MVNIKQQKKRILTDSQKRSSNRAFKSQMRTALKKTNEAIANNLENTSKLVNLTNKLLDKALIKKIKKPNFVKRNKSKIMKKMNKINKEKK